jgi:hypothetical protein
MHYFAENLSAQYLMKQVTESNKAHKNKTLSVCKLAVLK